MEFHGREIKFMRTVHAAMTIADMCEGKKIANLYKWFEGEDAEVYKNMATFVVLMNKGYEDYKAFMDPAYKPEYLKEDMFTYLPDSILLEMYAEASLAWVNDKPTVETEPSKKSKKKTSETSD